jgi:hypothetical protein
MTAYLLIILILVLLVVYAVRWFLQWHPRYRRKADDDLSKFFKELLDLDYLEKGFMVIEAPNKKRFIQFHSYTKGKKRGLQFDFPLAPWSEPYYEILEKKLYDRGIDYETQKTGEETVVSFITVDLKRDLARAMELAKLVLLEVFKLQPGDRIKIYLSQ